MDTCTNCGATLRPGAKFCTTCGTRLNDTPAPNAGWGTPQGDSAETTVLNAVQPAENDEPAGSSNESPPDPANSWAPVYGSGDSAAPGGDPAGRFISALDNEIDRVDEEEDEQSSQDIPASTWTTSTPVFTPPPPSNWSYSAGGEIEPEPEPESADDESDDSTWEPPSTWAGVTTGSEPEPEEPVSVDSAGFSDDGFDEVDSLSGDESVDVGGDEPPMLDPDDARDKAIALADELRRTIRMMSSGGESDHGAAVMALTEASLNVGDFSDLRAVVTDVKSDPRDIQTLANLAGKVDRIEALLEEHNSMAEAIETAIRELNG